MCDCYYDEVICPECGEIVNLEDLIEHLKMHRESKKTKEEVQVIEVKSL